MHRCAPRMTLRRGTKLLWVIAAAVAMPSSCGDDGEGPACWCVPQVHTIRIVPEAFEVTAGSRFELRALLYDENGTEIPEFHAYTPNWTIEPAQNATIIDREGHAVFIDVPNGTTAPFRVRAEAGFATKAASEWADGFVHNGAPAVDYLEAAPHITNEPLSVVLATGRTGASAWDNVNAVAFSGFARLGDLSAANGAVMKLSSDHAMMFRTMGWGSGVDQVTFRTAAVQGVQSMDSPQPEPPRLKKTLSIWINPFLEDEWTATTVAAISQLHVAEANRMFQRNRVGIEFVLAALYTLDGTIAVGCGAASVQGIPLGGGTRGTFNGTGNQNSIDVFVVDVPGKTGWSCLEGEGDNDPGFRIFINGLRTLPEVLAHELGHTFLKMSTQDHEDGADIGPTNLMVEGDSSKISRHPHLSLGQACAMNASALGTELRTLAGLPAVSTTSCPRISKSLR